MRKDDPQINLRIPPELKERIQQEAQKNRRTQTAEIIARLQESFEPTSNGNVVDEVRDLKRRFDEQSEALNLALRALRNPKAFDDATKDLMRRSKEDE